MNADNTYSEPSLIISSLQNQHIKNLIKLRNRNEREKQKVMIIEGYRCISRAIASKISILEIYYNNDLVDSRILNEIIKQVSHRNVKIYNVKENVFYKISYRENPEGILATAPIKEHYLSNLPISDNPFLIATESLEKPSNLGNIIRTADSVGADGLIICDNISDLYNPNTINASAGTVYSVNIAESSTKECIDHLKLKKINILATTPSALTLYSDIDMRGPIAIFVGSEKKGLSDTVLKNADYLIKIPMLGIADSLNVASTAAIMLYEAARQRGWKNST